MLKQWKTLQKKILQSHNIEVHEILHKDKNIIIFVGANYEYDEINIYTLEKKKNIIELYEEAILIYTEKLIA